MHRWLIMPRTYATKTGGRGGGSNKPFQDHRDPKPIFKETVPKRAAPGCKHPIHYTTSFIVLVLVGSYILNSWYMYWIRRIDYERFSSQYGTIPSTPVTMPLQGCSGRCLSQLMTTSSSTTPVPTTTASTARQTGWRLKPGMQKRTHLTPSLLTSSWSH